MENRVDVVQRRLRLLYCPLQVREGSATVYIVPPIGYRERPVTKLIKNKPLMLSWILRSGQTF